MHTMFITLLRVSFWAVLSFTNINPAYMTYKKHWENIPKIRELNNESPDNSLWIITI